MENQSEQTPHEIASSFPRVPGYLSVKEAARLIGVSERSVYGYIESGRLPGARIGNILVVEAELGNKHKRKAPGRLRVNTPVRHFTPTSILQYVTSLTV